MCDRVFSTSPVLCYTSIWVSYFLNFLAVFFQCPAKRGVLVDFPANSNQNTTSDVIKVIGKCTENSIPDSNGNPYMECYKNGSSEIFGRCKCIESYLVINNYCQSKTVIYFTFLLYIFLSLLVSLFHLFSFLIRFPNIYPSIFSFFSNKNLFVRSFASLFIHLFVYLHIKFFIPLMQWSYLEFIIFIWKVTMDV